MTLSKSIYFLAGLFTCIVLTSCTDKIEHGIESLEGRWTVSRIIEIENELISGGSASNGQIEQDNPEGMFEFSSDSVEYYYVLEGSEVSSVDEYTLTVVRVNSGFNKVDVFTLEVGKHTFSAEFGDQTKKSYKDATEIRLTETTSEMDKEFVTILELEKL